MTDTAQNAASSLWPYLVLNALAALWIAFSGIHAWHNSDSLIFSLASLYAWTPFFWQQDRVGMFIPLLASIIPDPIANVVFQTGLTVFVGLCAPLFLVELVYPHAAARFAIVLANAAMLALAPDRIRDNLLFECYYPLAMMLGCASLLLLGRGPGWSRWWRIVLAAGLLALAHWVYLGIALWLGPLALVRGWLQPEQPWPTTLKRVVFRPLLHARTGLACGLIGVTFLCGLGMMFWTKKNDDTVFIPTPSEGLPPAEWCAAWNNFAARLANLPGMLPWALALLGAAAVGAIGALAFRCRRSLPVSAVASILLTPAAAEFLFLGTRDWVAQNGYHPRYLLGTLESIQTLCAVLVALPLALWAATRSRRCTLFALAALALFGASLHRYGWPALDRPRRDLNALTEPWTGELEAAQVDAFGGTYWHVWPAVFRMNMKRRERGEAELFYGVSDRGRLSSTVGSEAWNSRDLKSRPH